MTAKEDSVPSLAMRARASSEASSPRRTVASEKCDAAPRTSSLVRASRGRERMALRIGFDFKGVREHGIDFLFEDRLIIGEIDAVVVGLRHFPGIDPRHFGRRGEQSLGFHEDRFFI